MDATLLVGWYMSHVSVNAACNCEPLGGNGGRLFICSHWQVEIFLKGVKMNYLVINKDNKQNLSSILICSTYNSYCEGRAVYSDSKTTEVLRV